jgi:hypothetical protein
MMQMFTGLHPHAIWAMRLDEILRHLDTRANSIKRAKDAAGKNTERSGFQNGVRETRRGNQITRNFADMDALVAFMGAGRKIGATKP